MRHFLKRISSLKFLTTLAVQVASVVAIFWPQYESTVESVAMRVAGLLILLLAAMGYSKIEADVDLRQNNQTNTKPY